MNNSPFLSMAPRVHSSMAYSIPKLLFHHTCNNRKFKSYIPPLLIPPPAGDFFAIVLPAPEALAGPVDDEAPCPPFRLGAAS